MYLIKNATIVNEGRSFVGSVLIEGEYIKAIFKADETIDFEIDCTEIDATGLLLFPGIIDDHVHFRDPGLTYKGDLFSESKAAIAGGITSFFDMPNTKPQATTIELLDKKFELAAEKSLANYSFLIGGTNDNLDELKKADRRKVGAVKIFMGSSTGNMLVDNEQTLNRVFAEIPLLIVTHCEDETIIRQNIRYYRELLGDEIPVEYHPLIRSAEACYKSTDYAIHLADKYNSRLHVAHLSTAKEMALFSSDKNLKNKRITAETCIHYLWFSDVDYARYGNRIKCNPAIKSETDRVALIEAVNTDKIDVIATDHAPHLWAEKEGSCLKATSGGPLVQHSLVAMLQLVKQGTFTLEKIVEKMCHAPAELYRIEKRGFIRLGYFADVVLVHPNRPWTVNTKNIIYKCGWSAFEGTKFDASVLMTWVNGKLIYDNGQFDSSFRGKQLLFNQ
jgi:dihydroorotase